MDIFNDEELKDENILFDRILILFFDIRKKFIKVLKILNKIMLILRILFKEKIKGFDLVLVIVFMNYLD